MSFQRFGDAVSGVLKGGAGQPVVLVHADNDLNTRLYLQLHNCSTGTVAADVANPGANEIGNATLVAAFAIPADDSRMIDLSAVHGLRLDGWASRFPDGVAFVWSTTRDTVTAHGAATDCAAQFWFGRGLL